MPTVGSDLDRCQRVLQDAATIGSDGLIWTRADLLLYYEDGYRTLLAETSAKRRFTTLDTPVVGFPFRFVLPQDTVRPILFWYQNEPVTATSQRAVDLSRLGQASRVDFWVLGQGPGRNVDFYGTPSAPVLMYDAYMPDSTPLIEADTPTLIPPQMQRYLRDYTLFRAFNAQGEGYDGSMALVYQARFARGMAVMRQLLQLGRKDRQATRTPRTHRRRRPPRVGLPANYPPVWR